MDLALRSGRACGRLLERWRMIATGVLATCLLLIAPLPLSAQLASFRRFDGRDGLPQSQVRTLLEDRNGFLWVGTYGGVARLGSLGFQTFEGIPGLKGSRAWALLETPDGAVWVGYQDGGLVRIAGNHCRIYGPQDGLEVVDTTALALDRESRVLVGTREGLYRSKGDGFERVTLPAPWNTSPLFDLAVDPQGGVWMGSLNGLLGRWDGKNVQQAVLPPEFREGSILAFSWDPKGRLWALGIHGLARRNEIGTWETIPIQGTDGRARLTGLSIGAGGEVLVAMGTDGVWQLEPDGSSRMLGPADGLPDEGINFALRDKAGHLWLGTNGNGLSVQAVPGLVQLGGSRGPDMGAVLAIREFRPGDFFIAGSRGLFRWQEGKGFLGHWGREEGLLSPEIWALEPDEEGGLWVASSKGLEYWKDGRIRPAPSPMNVVHITHFQREGERLWAGTDRGLMELDLKGRRLNVYPLPPEAGQRNVYSLLSTGEALVVGTMQGVYRFREGQFQKFWTDAPFSKQRITVIHQDTLGQFWVATTKGLYLLQDGHWSTFGVAEGLPDELIYFLGNIGKGRVVVGHGKGISLVDGSSIVNINQSLGLLSDETNEGGFLLDSRQRLWIGMIGGVSRLELGLLPSAPHLPPPVVLEAAWPGARQPFPQAVTLPPHTRTVDFHCELGLPITAFPPRFQAQLQGAENEWRTVEGGHVQYGQLAPGAYRLLVRASTDGRQWINARPLVLQVQPAWYEHPIGRIALILLALSGFLAVVLWRTRRLELAKRDLEARIQERTVALVSSERKAREASVAKSTFLANMSHELRTPLNAILGFAQLMARDSSQSLQTRENVERILRSGEHLLGLINDVLSISKIEAGKLTLNLRPFNSAMLLNGISEMAQVRAHAKGLAFRMDIDPGLPEVVEGDEGKLRQVLLNLVVNALKFTEKGSVHLRVRYDQGRGRFEVEDTGTGIAPAEMEQLFEAFHQTETGSKQTEGTGLGLHLGQAMVKLMGGEITVRSLVGQGSNFTFDIPLPEAKALAAMEAPRKVIGLDADQASLKILVVDDREENRVLLGRLLRMIGFQVEEARDGLEGLECWERWAPDLIWLDIRMPRLDGFETIRRIRAQEAERGLPRTTIIALTASAFDQDYEALLRSGFDDQVCKPFREMELFEMLTKHRGVRFRMEAPSVKPPQALAPSLDPARISALSPEWAGAFKKAVALGESAEALRLLEGLQDRDLAEELQKLVKAYRFEELSRLFGN